MAEWRIALFACTSSLATLRGLTSCMDKESLLFVIKEGMFLIEMMYANACKLRYITNCSETDRLTE